MQKNIETFLFGLKTSLQVESKHLNIGMHVKDFKCPFCEVIAAIGHLVEAFVLKLYNETINLLVNGLQKPVKKEKATKVVANIKTYVQSTENYKYDEEDEGNKIEKDVRQKAETLESENRDLKKNVKWISYPL